jgi:hypothetical protein
MKWFPRTRQPSMWVRWPRAERLSVMYLANCTCFCVTLGIFRDIVFAVVSVLRFLLPVVYVSSSKLSGALSEEMRGPDLISSNATAICDHNTAFDSFVADSDSVSVAAESVMGASSSGCRSFAALSRSASSIASSTVSASGNWFLLQSRGCAPGDSRSTRA